MDENRSSNIQRIHLVAGLAHNFATKALEGCKITLENKQFVDSLFQLEVSAFVEGAKSQFKDIEDLETKLGEKESELQSLRIRLENLQSDLNDKTDRLISVQERLPRLYKSSENIWDRSDDVLVLCKNNKTEIAYFEVHKLNGKEYNVWYKRDKEFDTKVELSFDREVTHWMYIEQTL